MEWNKISGGNEERVKSGKRKTRCNYNKDKVIFDYFRRNQGELRGKVGRRITYTVPGH